ncbi:hypothetical protein H6P81_015257 [Aristolochia fimbriata]|uniref:Uncharacterized protein n=1 Tax=Aristolochia fimbriata TaxID=158543 RepID=A0AAV7E4Z1_ARIFI|nr:hypothetical protein H6P81_015257 [Aristolochia fimbriata]
MEENNKPRVPIDHEVISSLKLVTPTDYATTSNSLQVLARVGDMHTLGTGFLDQVTEITSLKQKKRKEKSLSLVQTQCRSHGAVTECNRLHAGGGSSSKSFDSSSRQLYSLYSVTGHFIFKRRFHPPHSEAESCHCNMDSLMAERTELTPPSSMQTIEWTKTATEKRAEGRAASDCLNTLRSSTYDNNLITETLFNYQLHFHGRGVVFVARKMKDERRKTSLSLQSTVTHELMSPAVQKLHLCPLIKPPEQQ